jgi:hypothetical protein
MGQTYLFVRDSGRCWKPVAWYAARVEPVGENEGTAAQPWLDNTVLAWLRLCG